MDYTMLRSYVGSPEQLFCVRQSRLCGGMADGVRVVDVWNGGDLEVCVAADRCMDLPMVRFRGRCVNFITPNGMVHPSYYSPYGEGWSEAFAGGLLQTCGLCNTGPAGGQDWDARKEHGCIANRPAEHLNIVIEQTENGPVLQLSGTMREAMLAGANLSLFRTIQIAWRQNRIDITDVVRNEGYRRSPHMMLYHCNLGYPLLQPDSRVYIPHGAVRPRTAFAEKMLPRLGEILPPQDAMEESCYYYAVLPDRDGWAHIRMENAAEGIGFTLSYDASALDQFVQWENFVKGEYVMGLEPCNCTIDGREDAIRRGAMKYLQGGESVVYRLSFQFDCCSGIDLSGAGGIMKANLSV